MYELILENFAKHVSLNESEIEALLSRLKAKEFKKKDKVLIAGNICKSVSFVCKGCLRIYHVDDNGEEHITNFFPENWWACDVVSFYSQKPSFYSIDALEDSKVFTLAYHKLEELYSLSPKFERFFRILTQNGFAIYQRRMTSLLFRPASLQYTNLQKLFPKLEQRIAQKHIASYLGITPEFLSVLRKQRVGNKTI